MLISHLLSDGMEHPIAYASHTLTKNEQNYAQLEKEALSLIFGINSSTRTYMDANSFYILITSH